MRPYGNLSLAIYEPLQLGNARLDIDLNPDIVSLRYSTSLPGGFNGLEVGFVRQWFDHGTQQYRRTGYLQQPVDIRPFSHVELYDGMTLLWEGRIMMLRKPG